MENHIIESLWGSQLIVINQINDEYQIKDDKLIPYKRMVDDFKQYFVHITFDQIPRLDNKAADAMSTIASLLQILEQQSHYEFLVEKLFSPTYDNYASHIIYALTSSKSPLYGIIS